MAPGVVIVQRGFIGTAAGPINAVGVVQHLLAQVALTVRTESTRNRIWRSYSTKDNSSATKKF